MGDIVKLEQEDRDAIITIVAARYFSDQKWKWVNLRRDKDKIIEAYEELNQQYIEYPYMSRDWYVANSVTKNIHMCDTWNELKDFVDFLRAYGSYFDFLVRSDKKSLCIASEKDELSVEHKRAISEARKMRCNVFIFRARIPDSIEFELLQIGGGM